VPALTHHLATSAARSGGELPRLLHATAPNSGLLHAAAPGSGLLHAAAPSLGSFTLAQVSTLAAPRFGLLLHNLLREVDDGLHELEEGQEGGEGSDTDGERRRQMGAAGFDGLEEWGGSASGANIRLREPLRSLLRLTKQQKNSTERLPSSANQTLP
jgi:hypothetical protein